jgi:hypothetical protein
MTVIITLSVAGTDTGPFDLYTDLDGFATPFESGISRSSLLSGYTSSIVPDYANTIRVQSTGTCTNYVDITVTATTTTMAPSYYTYYRGSLNTNATSGDACLNAPSTQCFADALVPYNNMVLYTDSSLTTPIVANATYWVSLANPNDTRYAVQIGVDGSIGTSKVLC